MKTILGPIQKEKLILCSADAHPNSQRNQPGPAADFFPGAKWVGAVRNSAKRLGCKFVILTTGHGLVEPDDIISPFDVHIDRCPSEVRQRWEETIPRVLGEYKNSLLLFYSGGCPSGPYIKISKPIFHNLGISILSFGKPFMHDVDKIESCSKMLFRGCMINEIESILGQPDRLEFYYSVG